MTEYYPEAWRLLKIQHQNETYYKVFAGWVGGYATGSSWKLNSGCTKLEVDKYKHTFHGYSGSVYVCDKNKGRLDFYLNDVLQDFLDKFKGKGVDVSLVDDVEAEFKANGIEVVYLDDVEV